MPDGLPLLHDFGPELDLVRAFRVETGAIQRAKILARLRRRLEKARFDVRRLKDEVGSLYVEAAQHDAAAMEFMQRAQTFIGSWQATAERFRSEVMTLEEQSTDGTRIDEETEIFFRDSLILAAEWLDAVATFRTELLGFSEARAVPVEILRAHPLTGQIDHTALSREFIARFPKIRAALAK